MNHPAQAFFSPHILTIYVFGRYKHDSKLYAKLLIFSRRITICGLFSEYYTEYYPQIQTSNIINCHFFIIWILRRDPVLKYEIDFVTL